MGKAILELEGVKKYYTVRKGFFNKQVGVKRVINGIDIMIEEGQTVALVGESGCGKSVLLRMLIGLEPPTEGRIRFGGIDLTSM